MRKQIGIRMDEKFVEKVKKAAAKAGLSLNTYVFLALKEKLEGK